MSYPQEELVNDHILNEVKEFRYTYLSEMYRLVIRAGHYFIIFKRDMKDAFKNMLVLLQY